MATARLLGQTTGAALVALTFHVWRDVNPWIALWMGCAFSLAGSAASFLRLVVGTYQPLRSSHRAPAPLPIGGSFRTAA